MESTRTEITDTSNVKAKLFVGQIPREMTEDHLRVFFEPFGPLREVSIIRDPLSGISRGCAFVIFHERNSAQDALDNLHNTLQLPNASNPLQVRFAETPLDRENKLFVGMLPKTFTENELVDMFSPFGEIKEIHIIRGPEGSPKGCAFVKFIEKEGASAAIDALHETIPTGATRPLVVKFAESKKLSLKSEGTPTRDNIIVAKQSLSFQSHMQPVPQQSQLSHYDVRPTTLMHPYAHHIPSIPQTHSSPNYGGSPLPPMSAYPFQGNMAMQSTQIPLGPASLASAASQSPHLRPPEGPDGANLFIYHLPRDITDADLATLFAPFGNVISAKVFVDKKTSDSKGFGFVSYDSFDSANNAIESMNGFQIGSKRLKVQHKRVGSSLWGTEDSMPHQRTSSMGRSERGPPPPPPFSQYRHSAEPSYPSSNFAHHVAQQGSYGSGYGLPHSTGDRY